MFPKVGDKVRINPAWIAKHDREFDSDSGVYDFMRRHGFCGIELTVISVHEREVVEVDSGRHTMSVCLSPDGGYKGVDLTISYFVLAADGFNSTCPLCGSSGWIGFNMFHCGDAACRNGR